jgi:alpha 1,3-glucosidase
MSHIPVFQRAGSIIARKMRIRRSSSLAHHDPFTLFVAIAEPSVVATLIC